MRRSSAPARSTTITACRSCSTSAGRPPVTISAGRSATGTGRARTASTSTTSNEPYPVFIVAAAGGGAYSAHYTATFLARMQDSCPNFAQHVFAISGVSGGSIGASLFAGLSKLKAKNQDYVGCNFAPVRPLLREAHAEVLRAGLSLAGHRRGAVPRPRAALPAVPRRSVRPLARARREPRGGVDRHDRGRRQGGPLGKGHGRAHSRARSSTCGIRLRSDEAVPSLILNATEVANGYRIVMSPIDDGRRWRTSSGRRSRACTRCCRTTRTPSTEPDIKLSTAAGISARFPWVLPAATVETGAGRRRCASSTAATSRARASTARASS